MVSTERLDALVDEWRSRSGEFRRMGLSQPADQMDAMAADLEAEIAAWLEEVLTLEQAATESGYSYKHLQELVADDTIPNAGKPGAPRILRCDLPVKPGGGRPVRMSLENFATDARASSVL